MKISATLCLSVLLCACFTAAIAQQSPEDWYAKGVTAANTSQKVVFFTKAIQLDPDYAEAYNARAAVRFGLGMAKEAVQDFDRSIHIDPTRAFTFYSRASCQLALGKYEAAIEDFDQVIQLQPAHVYAMSGKGCALLSQGKAEAAVAVLDETLALDGTVQSAVRCRDQALKKLGRPVPAKTVANKTKRPEAAKDAESTDRYLLNEATGMREAPTHTSRVLLRFDAGNEVKLLEKTDEFWWKVRYKGKVGYAKAATLTALD